MKILFTANRFPYPPYRGDKLKIYHLAKRLARKHEVHLVTFLQDKADLQYLPELQKIFTEIYLVPLTKSQSYFNVLSGFLYKEPFQVRYFHSRKMEAKIQELIVMHDYDAVHVQHLRMAQYWAFYNDIPRILDLPDAFSLYWKRRIAASKGLPRIFNKIEQARVFNYEKILGRYDLSLVCSKEDSAYLKTERGIDNIGILPNGVDTATFSAKGHDYNISDTILFTGNMDYAPNVDAVQYFVQDILPLIRKQLPGIRFIIAGQRPVKKVTDLAGEGVTVTGFVKDLKDMYAKAGIVVAPLRFGAGTQNKVLEAMAMGVPIVSHHIGFNGLDIQSGQGVILAPGKEQFAGECIALLRSASQREAVGKAGKEIIRTRYDWDVVAQKLEDYFSRIRKP